MSYQCILGDQSEPEQIRGFFANLAESCIAAIQQRQDVTIDVKSDTEDMFDPAYGDAPVDVMFMGQEFRICVGRPAQKAKWEGTYGPPILHKAYRAWRMGQIAKGKAVADPDAPVFVEAR